METIVRCSARVLVFGASLRKNSLNDLLASLAATTIEEKGWIADRATLTDFECPSYDSDVEQDVGVPAGAQRLRDRLIATDAFVIASPEYNSSMPGILKNVIDWTSRIRPQPFNGKQCLLMSASPSMSGGNRGLWSLRVPLEHLGARVYPDMFSLAEAHQAMEKGGKIKSDVLQERFDSTIECFMDLVEAAKHYPALKKQWIEFLGEPPEPLIDRVETADVQVVQPTM
ncbi:MAG TPA: NAD(P)H-dependent oxidoreductase [Gemmatimonadaceae bacterium]|nr:NAD(P)H-dependent oxidoreductase [Gemmatimonadaceae bacterium]